MITVEQRIAEVAAKTCTVVTMATAELKNPIVYVSRAHVLAGVIRDTLRAMSEVEADGAPSDFTDEWRDMRLMLAHAQSQFESVINGSGDLASSLPACRPKSSRY